MAAATPPNLDPPFRGYIETTFDALLVFEAARRGMIPRVTRRLIERERGMVQSGAVFVFDEHESGIKRWTDGLVWSPSRILGNFLVYRETDKRPNNPPTPMSTSGAASSSPQQSSPSSLPQGMAPPQQYDTGVNPILGHGALPRPRSGSDGGGIDRQRERQLVGSLTNSYKFKENGLVKKTMSVTVNGFAQHMISYYSVEDVLNGKLRSPSTIPELAALEISPEYLHKQNFRFPPMIEIGQDGIPRYRGEPEEPTSPTSPMNGMSIHSFPPPEYDAYGQPIPPHSVMRVDQSSTLRARTATVPMPIPVPPQGSHPYMTTGPSSATSAYFDHSQISTPPPIVRQNSNSSMHSASGAIRPGSSSRRYDPYHPSSPRMSGGQHHGRRQSQPLAPVASGVGEYYAPSPTADVKPHPLSPNPAHATDAYNYQPPATAPSAFADFGSYQHPPPPVPPATGYAPQYATWHPAASVSGRFQTQQPRDYTAAPPSSSGSSGGSVAHPLSGHSAAHPASNGVGEHGSWNGNMVNPAQHPGTWDGTYAVQDSGSEWRGHASGTSVG